MEKQKYLFPEMNEEEERAKNAPKAYHLNREPEIEAANHRLEAYYFGLHRFMMVQD